MGSVTCPSSRWQSLVSYLGLLNAVFVFFPLRETSYMVVKSGGPSEGEQTGSNSWKGGPHDGSPWGADSPVLIGGKSRTWKGNSLFCYMLHNGTTDFNPMFYNSSSNIFITALTIVMTEGCHLRNNDHETICPLLPASSCPSALGTGCLSSYTWLVAG